MSVSSTIKAPEQVALPFERDEKALQHHLQHALGERISLTVTDNSTSMISSCRKKGVLFVRLHGMFLTADVHVIDEIVKFLRNSRCKTPLIRRYIKENSGLLKARPPRTVSVKTQGRHHDLSEIFSRLNDDYFGGGISARITWGTRKRGRAAVRLRTLGSYSRHTHTIRINPVLDSKSVPRYFVEFVLYHEMLHADVGTEKKGGRRIVHSRSFREREMLFADYERALAWEKKWTGRDCS
ncbi:MAG: SprT-like domain-containing protein [Candidatus Sulfobium sp.]|jgi:hypothetical protein